MAYVFEEEASRDQVWLRAFLMGATGSGKSKGALELARRIFDGALKTTLINTEKGRGKLYADRYKFSYIGMDAVGDFSPDAYIAAIDVAERNNPGGIFILDSVSHEWVGSNGILQQADRFGDWKTVRPKHNAWVERLLSIEGHLIVTVRAKMKYEVSEEQVPGREKPRQVVIPLGVGPIQSDDLQYEFNLVGRFDVETHDVAWSGHVDPLVDTVSNFADDESAQKAAEALTKWLSEGDPIEPPVEADPKAIEELLASLRAEGFAEELIEEKFGVARRQNRGKLHPDYVAKNLEDSKKRLEKKKPAADAANGAGEAQPTLEGTATKA